MQTISSHNVTILKAFVNSSIAFWIRPPRKCLDVYVKIGKADKSCYYEPIRCVYSPEADKWKCVVPPVFLPIGCITQYKVVARDVYGYRMNIGQNILRVVSDGIADANENTNVTAVRDCHIQLDGEWYAVRVINDGTSLAFDVAQSRDELSTAYKNETGASPTTLNYKDPYAFNAATNTYHKVTAYTDDTGTISAKVDEEGIEDGEKSFCYDSETGFWYEMDSVIVDGEQSLVVGEAK